MKIMVMDGQGGGIGRALIEALRAKLGSQAEIAALGTNAAATSAMMKAGADRGATGENAVVVCALKADVILGSVGILAADAMLGEITPAMARAVAQSPAEKILIPLNRCGIHVVGTENVSLPQSLAQAVEAAAKAAAPRHLP